MVDNYTHFESLHKLHPDLAGPVFAEVESLRTALDAFRLAVANRVASQYSTSGTDVENADEEEIPALEPLTTEPLPTAVDAD